MRPRRNCCAPQPVNSLKPATSNPLRIGASADSGSPGEFFPGVIQNVAVYDTVLDFGLIVDHYWIFATGYEPSDELGREISAFVREHHSQYAYPRLIEFVPDLPKTLTGKIRRIELRQREAGSG